MAGTGSRRLALDHLTAVDQTPVELVETAHATGYAAVAMFLTPIRIVPNIPHFDLIGDRAARRELAARMAGYGIALDAVYPVGLLPETDVARFAPFLELAGELGARFVNILSYDPEPARRLEIFGAFVELSQSFGVNVVAEIFPLSEIRTLETGLQMVEAIGRPGEVGLMVDVLHVMRAGNTLAELAAAPRDYLLYGQLCDGILSAPRETWAREGTNERLLPGEGEFDLKGFVAALPEGCPLSVEVPRDSDIATLSPHERARRAYEATVRALGRGVTGP